MPDPGSECLHSLLDGLKLQSAGRMAKKRWQAQMVQNMGFISRTSTEELRHGTAKMRFAFIKVSFIAAQGTNCHETFKT